ncbi:MAG: hypothetical protein ACM338_00720 [Betaproteobacteria bacterium]
MAQWIWYVDNRATGQTMRMPRSPSGKVVYEREPGVVVGKICRAVAEGEAAHRI